MNPRLLAIPAALVSLILFQASAPAQVKSPPKGFTALFNGKDLSGWHGMDISPYKLAALIGAGGVGEVYRARDTRLGREVALNVIHAEVARDPERIMVVNIRGGADFEAGTPRLLFRTTLDRGEAGNWAVSHDGRRFIMSAPGTLPSPRSVIVVADWTKELALK